MVADKHRKLIYEVARTLVNQVSPEEVLLFTAQSEAYFRNPEASLRPQGGKDVVLGSGEAMVLSLITPAALDIVSELYRFVVEQAQAVLKTQRARAIEAAVQAVLLRLTSGTGARPESEPSLSLAGGQVDELRRMIHNPGSILKIPEMKLRTLEDMILAGLLIL